VYRSLELSPSNSTSGIPGSDLAGETLYQKLQTSQPTDTVAMKSMMSGIMEDMVESTAFWFNGLTIFDVQLESGKGAGIVCIISELDTTKMLTN
jgi:hypothetical protein